MTILLMVIIGAFIGGLTNYLAIKMLFHPHQPKYIGKWRVPFTPGVIPKRRDQLAKQLGQLVVNHLLTVESLQLKLQDPVLKQQLEQKAVNEWENFLQQSTTIQHLHVNIDGDHLQAQLADRIVDQVEAMIETHREEAISQWLDRIINQEDLKKMEQLLREKLVLLLSSDMTKQKMELIIQSYAASKGFAGKMILSMISGEELAGKVQRLLADYLLSADGRAWLREVLEKEWHDIRSEKVQIIEPILKKESTQQVLYSIIKAQLPVNKWLSAPLQEMLRPYSDQFKQEVIPRVVQRLLESLSGNTAKILQEMKVAEMVENQVAKFPISRIEELVLSISRKEFTLITYLGALLGGIIGLIQAILFIVF